MVNHHEWILIDLQLSWDILCPVGYGGGEWNVKQNIWKVWLYFVERLHDHAYVHIDMQTNTYILEYFHKQMNILDDAMGNLFFLISSLVAFERCNTHTYVHTYLCMCMNTWHTFISCTYVCMYEFVYVNTGVRVFWRALPCRAVLSEIFLSLQGRQFRWKWVYCLDSGINGRNINVGATKSKTP